MASSEASDGFDAWDELAIGATGEDAPVRVRLALWLHLPNRRMRTRMSGGVGGAERPLSRLDLGAPSMSVKIKAALIAGVVALVTSTISSFATFWQIQAAQSMQIMSLRNELIKPQFEQRLAAQASAYPNVLRVLKALSDSLDNLSPQKIRAL